MPLPIQGSALHDWLPDCEHMKLNETGYPPYPLPSGWRIDPLMDWHGYSYELVCTTCYAPGNPISRAMMEEAVYLWMMTDTGRATVTTESA